MRGRGVPGLVPLPPRHPGVWRLLRRAAAALCLLAAASFAVAVLAWRREMADLTTRLAEARDQLAAAGTLGRDGAAVRRAVADLEQQAAAASRPGLPERVSAAELVSLLDGAARRHGVRLHGIQVGPNRKAGKLTAAVVAVTAAAADPVRLAAFLDAVQAGPIPAIAHLTSLPLAGPVDAALTITIYSQRGVVSWSAAASRGHLLAEAALTLTVFALYAYYLLGQGATLVRSALVLDRLTAADLVLQSAAAAVLAQPYRPYPAQPGQEYSLSGPAIPNPRGYPLTVAVENIDEGRTPPFSAAYADSGLQRVRITAAPPGGAPRSVEFFKVR